MELLLSGKLHIRRAWLLVASVVFIAAPVMARQKPLRDRLNVSVNGEAFRFSVDVDSVDDCKIRVSKQVNGEWVRQFRHVQNIDFYDGMETLDWNEDGYVDVRVRLVTGGSSEKEDYLFLFDPLKNQYRNIDKFWWYCGSYDNPVRVAGTDGYYFSHIYWGCGGLSWESVFFKIEAYRVRVAGSMHIDFCDDPGEVRIYKHYLDGSDRCEQIAKIPSAYINEHYWSEDHEAWKAYCENFWRKHYDRILD